MKKRPWTWTTTKTPEAGPTPSQVTPCNDLLGRPPQKLCELMWT